MDFVNLKNVLFLLNSSIQYKLDENTIDEYLQSFFQKNKSAIQHKTCTDILKAIAIDMSSKINNRFLNLAGAIQLYILKKSISPGDVSLNTIFEKYLSAQSNLNQEYITFCKTFQEQLIDFIKNHKMFDMSYVSVMNFIDLYAAKDINNKVIELPEFMMLRVAFTVSSANLANFFKSFELFLNGDCTHASPTLFNAAFSNQLASCFLLKMEDSIDGIYQCIKDSALITKYGGGLGIDVSDIRAAGSLIKSQNGGVASGVVPVCRNIECMTNYVKQVRRRGAASVTMNVYHKDILDFLKLRLNNGAEEKRARDLFLCVILDDIFIERVKQNSNYTLFCPTDVPLLKKKSNNAFIDQYCQYESHFKKYNGKQVKAQLVWRAILKSLTETGTPYLLKHNTMQHSSHANLFRNKLNMTNLCAEIIQFTGKDCNNENHIAMCNLATINLANFIKEHKFDFQRLGEVTEVMINNLNNVIDTNLYNIEACKTSNLSLRPIGLGIQGLSTLFQRLGIPYCSAKAEKLNFQIFEYMYYHAMKKSIELAKTRLAFKFFDKSILKHGHLQFDYTKNKFLKWSSYSLINEVKWNELRDGLVKFGCLNSLLIACPPTASTSILLQGTESFECRSSNIYMRNLASGSYIFINKELQEMLEEKNAYNQLNINQIIQDNGSVKNVKELSDFEKDIFKTAYEISMKQYITMAAQRQMFIDNSQSMNLFFSNPTDKILSAAIMHAYKMDCKTLVYYLKRKSSSQTEKFYLKGQGQKESNSNDDQDCLMCSS